MVYQLDLDHCYNFVMSLTIESGKIIKEAIQGNKNIETKLGDWDLVTEYDKKIEKILIAGLAKEFPDHQFIGEETVASTKFLPELTDAPTWIIDPIDGTTNFVHSFPHTCISIALVVKRNIELGIVYNPILEQLFTARRGQGAYLNEKRIQSSKISELRMSLVCIEASYAAIKSTRDLLLGRVEAFVSIAHGIRVLGSAALTLCHIAMGAAELYLSDNLYPWDVAAGVIIIREAGGEVYDTSGGEFNLMKPRVLAVGCSKLALEVAKLIRSSDDKVYRKRIIDDRENSLGSGSGSN